MIPLGLRMAATSPSCPSRDDNYEIYVIELREAGSGETPLDDGDSPATATPVAVGESIEGELSAGDIDYFRVTVSSPGTLVASTTGSTDTYGVIEDSSGNVLNENDDSGEGHNFRVSAVVRSGTYYIRVVGSLVSSTGAYTLTLQMEEGSDGSGGDWVAGAIRRLTDHSAEDRYPSWSPDGRHIAFVSDRDGNDEIYVMGSDGSNPRRLTDHLARDFDPTWSPDGRHIAFVSDRDGNREIYVIGSDGSNPRRLTHRSVWDGSPTWSPDGRHIAFESQRGSNFGIYVMGLDGSNPHRLTDDLARYYSPSWSPDGRHIAFESQRDGNRDIYVMGSDGSNPRRLTTDGGSRSPTWSPDGRHIAFQSDLNTYWDIYVIGSDGSNPRNLTNHPARDADPYWSPGGRLTSPPVDDFSPTWSPDGRHIAFESDRDGNGEIYVKEFWQTGNGGTPLAVGESIKGDLSAGDSDYFRVTVTSPGTLMASTTGSTDTYGSIEDSSGNVLNENDHGGEGRNFLVSAGVEPGTYYIRVHASSTGAYTLTLQMEEGPAGSFDIEFVFLVDFTVEEQELWHRMAWRWGSAIQTGSLDFEFPHTWFGECGDHLLSIPAGEQIADLRIYITKFDEIDHLGRRVDGWGGPKVLRRSSSMPVIGCIGIEQNNNAIWTTGLHEIGHVLGIGSIWDDSGMLRGLNTDAHFAGPQAIAAFDQAGGTNYPDAKVPTEQDGAHWRLSVLAGELMIPSGATNILSAITLGALSDLGYSVDFSAADPYVLPSPTAAKPVADAVPFCSLEGLPAPVYVDD